jgi:hypothetical protein
MLSGRFSKFLAAVALAIAFVACAGISGGSEAKAQGYYRNYYRGRHWDRDDYRRYRQRERYQWWRHRQRDRWNYRRYDRFDRYRYNNRFGRYPYRRW